MVYNASGKYRRVFVTSFNLTAMESLNVQELVDNGTVRYLNTALPRDVPIITCIWNYSHGSSRSQFSVCLIPYDQYPTRNGDINGSQGVYQERRGYLEGSWVHDEPGSSFRSR